MQRTISEAMSRSQASTLLRQNVSSYPVSPSHKSAYGNVGQKNGSKSIQKTILNTLGFNFAQHCHWQEEKEHFRLGSAENVGVDGNQPKVLAR